MSPATTRKVCPLRSSCCCLAGWEQLSERDGTASACQHCCGTSTSRCLTLAASCAPAAAEAGSQYDEAGVLTAELASFVDVRLVQPGPSRQAGQPPAEAPQPEAAQPLAAAAAGAEAALGPTSYSQLGPPRPAAIRGEVVAAEGGWAALYQQLQQRRAQLAKEQAPGPEQAEAGTPPARAADSATRVQSAPPAVGSRAGGRPDGTGQRSSLTPGATRPRAGVRRSALGPMMRHLREAQEFS